MFFFNPRVSWNFILDIINLNVDLGSSYDVILIKVCIMWPWQVFGGMLTPHCESKNTSWRHYTFISLTCFGFLKKYILCDIVNHCNLLCVFLLCLSCLYVIAKVWVDNWKMILSSDQNMPYIYCISTDGNVYVAHLLYNICISTQHIRWVMSVSDSYTFGTPKQWM